ncbi:MAG: hypothetical protein V1712_04080 [Patescibacteria group bacterium]
MLNQDEVKQIGQVVEEKIKQNNQALRQELGEVIEQNIASSLDDMQNDIKDMQNHLNRIERKVDKAFIDGLDRHEKWIKQIASKIGITLEA